jgi:maltose/moltooligosaccharide transporter
VANVAEAGEKIPPSVRYSFYLGGAVFFLAVLWTVIRTREYSPQELKEFEEEKMQSQGLSRFVSRSPVELLKSFFTQGFLWLIIGVAFSYLIYAMEWDKELFVISVGLAVFGIILLVTAWHTRQGLTRNGLVEVMTDLMNMPKTMRQLAIVQFFSWFALFAMWIYSTPAVTSHIYGTSDTTTALYNEGANWVGFLFAIYNGFAALMAFVLPVMARATSRKIAHAISLVIGGLGLMSFFVIKDPHLLLISMVGIGIAWASILSMPYAILTGSLPAQKMGTYMGIFNFFIVIPQIFAASILGFFTKTLFHGHAIYALVLGGASLVVAAISVLFVDDIDQR